MSEKLNVKKRIMHGFSVIINNNDYQTKISSNV